MSFLTLLDTINSREALCALNDAQLRQLCDEIRQFLVLNVARTGGHLASNLGVVELSVALERVFDTSRDRLLFDVGHQSYVHKILTGRRDEFRTLRMFGGLAGFPKPSESVTDPFVAGHASSSVSTALGMARARTLQHEDYHVVALMGDGAMTGGLAYEAMNDAGESSEQLIVILNDNGMSITPNVGGIAQHLALIRTRPGYYRIKKAYRAVTAKVPGGKCLYRLTHRLKEHWKRMLFGTTFFEEMGFEYYGPVDGHDLKRLEYMLRLVKDRRHPVLLHVITQKGKGYAPAEENPDVFHGIGHFDPEKGMEPRCGYIDTEGREVLPAKWDDAGEFSEMRAPVMRFGVNSEDFYDARWGYIATNGQLVVPFKYHEAYPFSCGLARVFVKGLGYGYINRKGEELVPCKYQEAEDFHDFTAKVKQYDRVMTIDDKGQIVEGQ